MAARPRNWVKLWVDWIDSKAHAELSEGAFGLGPLLLLLAVWDGQYESGGWLLNEAGAPMSYEALARLTHRSVARLQVHLKELEWCNTIQRREDGAWGFPKFGKWQESKSAKSMRLKRSHDGSQSGNSEPKCEPQTEDGRRGSLREPTPTPPRRGKSPPAQLDLRVAAVLDRIDVHRERLRLPKLSDDQRAPNTILARLKAGVTVEKLLAVADAFGRYCDRNPSKRSILNASTPFTGPSGERGGGFAWGLSMLDEDTPSKPDAPKSELPSIHEIRRRDAEERP